MLYEWSDDHSLSIHYPEFWARFEGFPCPDPVPDALHCLTVVGGIDERQDIPMAAMIHVVSVEAVESTPVDKSRHGKIAIALLHLVSGKDHTFKYHIDVSMIAKLHVRGTL